MTVPMSEPLVTETPLRPHRAWALLLVLAAVPTAVPSCVTAERIATGLANPVFATAAPGDNNRLLVVEQVGRIRALNLASRQLSTFLDLSSLVQSGGEEGLLGLAFHPQFASNRRFYVYFTAKYTTPEDRATQVVEFRTQAANPSLGDLSTARLVLRIAQPQDNHNGGWLGFGPDGFLYVATGDGGGGNDDGNGHTPGIGNAQDLTDNLLGKILRIHPDPTLDAFPADPDKNYGIPAGNPFVGVAGDDEIYLSGLRNPWRCSFDRNTGDLWIADVGQGAREEVNFLAAGTNAGGNLGWRLREGTIATPASGIGGPAPAGAIEPLYDYPHGFGTFEGRSVTGGYVYRGPIASLRGRYFFADFVNRKVWSLTRSGNTATDLVDWTTRLRPTAGSIGGLSAFGEDNNGNLYLVDYDGEIFLIKDSSLRSASSPLSSGRWGW